MLDTYSGFSKSQCIKRYGVCTERQQQPEKKLKQREPKIVQINPDQEQNQEQEHAGKDDNDEQDEKLASKFYTNLQKNIDDDDDDDDEVKGENSADQTFLDLLF